MRNDRITSIQKIVEDLKIPLPLVYTQYDEKMRMLKKIYKCQTITKRGTVCNNYCMRKYSDNFLKKDHSSIEFQCMNCHFKYLEHKDKIYITEIPKRSHYINKTKK